jgi:hypothetical protein
MGRLSSCLVSKSKPNVTVMLLEPLVRIAPADGSECSYKGQMVLSTSHCTRILKMDGFRPSRSNFGELRSKWAMDA